MAAGKCLPDTGGGLSKLLHGGWVLRRALALWLCIVLIIPVLHEGVLSEAPADSPKGSPGKVKKWPSVRVQIPTRGGFANVPGGYSPIEMRQGAKPKHTPPPSPPLPPSKPAPPPPPPKPKNAEPPPAPP
ncbi:hypothetical protein CSUI_005544, partial [Cystoisospora suis]